MGSHIKLAIHAFATDRTNVSENIVSEKLLYGTVGFEVGYGYRAIISNRFLLSMSIKTCLLPLASIGGGYRSEVGTSLQERYGIGLNLSLGVLL